MFYKKRKKYTFFDMTLTAVSTGAIAYLMTKSMRDDEDRHVDSRQDLSDLQGKQQDSQIDLQENIEYYWDNQT